MEQQPEIQVDTGATPFSSEAPGSMATPQTEQSWKETAQPYIEDLKKIFGEASELLDEIKQPLVYGGIALAALITIKLIFALIGALNDIPLLAPTFELIGILYSIWFGWRYLYKASGRKELDAEIDAIKTQVFGEK